MYFEYCQTLWPKLFVCTVTPTKPSLLRASGLKIMFGCLFILFYKIFFHTAAMILMTCNKKMYLLRYEELHDYCNNVAY